MHLKVFMKLKKTLKTLSSGQKNPKKPKKPKKTQKNPLGWVFFKKTRVFSNPAHMPKLPTPTTYQSCPRSSHPPKLPAPPTHQSCQLLPLTKNTNSSHPPKLSAPPTCRVGIKKPTQKNPPKKNQKTHLKKPTKNGFFWVFFNFLFFMKIIKIFLFQTDFL